MITAEFRETNVQDTPIAITAITGEMMNARSQSNLFEVAAQAPNVTLKPGGQARSGMVAFIRGVGQDDFVAALEPGVGIYVDDVYYSTLTGSLLDLLDLQRVEVLRGPQGTLAGRNSIGGAIKLYSKKPGSGGSSAQASYGSLNRVDVRATADFTLVPDKLAARVSGAARHRDGYVDVLDYGCTHPGSGVPTYRTSHGCKVGTNGNQSYVSTRAAILWTPTPELDINIIGDVVADNSETAAGVLLYGDNPSTAFSIDDGDPATPPVYYQNHIFVPYGPNHNPADPITDKFVNYATMLDTTTTQDGLPVPWKPARLPSRNTLNMWGLSGKIDYRLSDMLTLTSITAYRHYNSEFNQDSDLSPIAVTLVGNRVWHSQWSEEIRLNGVVNDFLDWTVGGFYFDQKSFYEGRIDLNYADLDFIHGPDPTPATTWALFAHTVFHLTDRLNLSGGVRYSDEAKDYTHHRHNPDNTDIGTYPNGINVRVLGVNGLLARFRDTRFDWRVALDYHWTDGFMTYGQVSTGYKGGGVNPRPFFPQQLQTFNPETLTAYELGFKSTLLDNKMRLNGAIFYNDYKNIQLTLTSCERPSPPFPTPIGPPCAKPANVGSAHVKGGELEVEVYPVEGLSIDGSVSYIDFQYTFVDPAALTGSIIAPLDMVTPYTPKWKWSGGAQYTFPATSFGSFTARIDASYQSSIYASATNASTNYVDSYTLANIRLTWRSHDEDWQLAFEVTNLFDKYYFLNKFDQAGSVGQVTGQPGLPRQWAVTVKRNF